MLRAASDVSVDNENRWRHRPPPKGLLPSELELCKSFRLHGSCRLGLQCTLAHGPEELYEWSLRCKLRQQEVVQAAKAQPVSFITLLQSKLSSPDEGNFFTSTLPHVQVSTPHKLNVTLRTKPCMMLWTFEISSREPLCLVGLLHDNCRENFKIVQVVKRGGVKAGSLLSGNQEWHNTSGGNEMLILTVKFKSKAYGSFHQSIAFSFGAKPYLVQELKADVYPADEGLEFDGENRDLKITSSNFWTEQNSLIFRLEETGCDPHEKELLDKYPPLHNGVKLSSLKLADKMDPANYKERMHGLLYIEEQAQAAILSKFNVTAKLAVFSDYLLHSGTSSSSKYSQNGQLYGKMSLNTRISEDTPAGRLILNNCSTAYLSLNFSDGTNDPNVTKARVYECTIEDKTKEDIYFKFTAKMVSDLALKPDAEYIAQVQFLLNRVPFCNNHWAIDLCSTELLFPDKASYFPIPASSLLLESRTNEQQQQAISAIASSIETPLPPVVISGPFGTGKTYTFAKAIEVVLQQQDTRILVCTHSNSAADLYVKDYLDPLVKNGNEQCRPLRIFYKMRWIATVHATVLEYSLLESSSSQYCSFRVPTAEDVLRHRVIVTTLSTAGYLLRLGLPKGYFTHIMIDEAAQGTECDMLLPLSLADHRTRIALAGDHMQLSPEIFSQVARDKLFQVSLLERLYDYYPPDFPCRIMLCNNYRSHSAIVQFTSELFYENKLKSCSDAKPHNRLFPLTFFSAKGSDVQDTSSTSFYNNAEVYEVTEQIATLLQDWPDDLWGKFDSSSVGIVTPYADQVSCIRAHLRKKQLFGVNVERVLNVQGKQYRVIILSTVRTRATCVKDSNDKGSRKKSILRRGVDENGDSDEELDDEDRDEESQFGFLSSARLLNTAVTRARSLVIVVGDPVALCSVGKCRKLWERYMEVCRNNGSFNGMSWLNLRSHLDALEMKKLYGLNPLAPEFVPSIQRKQISTPPKPPLFAGPPVFPPPHPGLPNLPPWYPVGLEQQQQRCLEEALLIRMLAQRKPPPQFSMPPPLNRFLGPEPPLLPVGPSDLPFHLAAQLRKGNSFAFPAMQFQAKQHSSPRDLGPPSPIKAPPVRPEAMGSLSQRPISKPLTVQQLEAELLKKDGKQQYPPVWSTTKAKEESVWEPFCGPPLWGDTNLFKSGAAASAEEKNSVPLYLRTSSSTSTASEADLSLNLESFLSLTEDAANSSRRSSLCGDEDAPLWDDTTSVCEVDYEQSSLQFENVLRDIRTNDVALHDK